MIGRTTAAILVQPGQPVEIDELEIPALKPGQVLVQLAYAGLCHTQLSEVRGRRGPDPYVPHCLGHEGSGTVSAVGPDVAKVKPGDLVAMTWLKGTGANVPGTVYRSARLGAVNAGAITTFMTSAVVAENRLVPISAGFDMEVAALLGCAVPTGAGVIRRTAAAKAGDSVVVFGTGGIGLVAIMAAKLQGCQPVIAVDVVDDKLAAARRLGASHAINAAKEDPVAAVKAIAANGVDIAVEASGKPRAMEQAYAVIRAGGGRTILAGNAAAGERISIDPFNLILGRRLLGTWGGETVVDEDLPAYAAAYAAGNMPLKQLISHRFALSEINAAFEALESGRVLRALIDLTAGP